MDGDQYYARFEDDDDNCPYCDLNYTDEGGLFWATTHGTITMISHIEGCWHPEGNYSSYHIYSKLKGILEGISIPSDEIEYCPKCGRYLH